MVMNGFDVLAEMDDMVVIEKIVNNIDNPICSYKRGATYVEFMLTECRYLHRLIETGFSWELSPEGFDYWNDIFSELYDGVMYNRGVNQKFKPQKYIQKLKL